MFYTIYQITNNVNGKIYIGKHQTKDFNDGYMGSGKHLRRAIAKYGIENFKKEILFQFDNENEMNAKEAELVTEEFCLREDTYNLCPGGKGGWGYINQSKDPKYTKQRHENAKKIPKESKVLAGKRTGSKNLKDAHIKGKIKYNNMLGKNHTEETKRKIGNSNSIRQSANNNSQYGTIWISNGVEAKKIKKEECIPEGWHKGRK